MAEIDIGTKIIEQEGLEAPDFTQVQEGDVVKLATGSFRFTPEGTFEPVGLSSEQGILDIEAARKKQETLTGPIGITSAEQFQTKTGREATSAELQQIDAGILSFDPATGKTFSQPKTIQEGAEDERTPEEIETDRLISMGVSSADMTGAQRLSVDLRKQEIEVQEAKNKLKNFDQLMGQDPQLRNILQSIGATWDTRVTEMADINRRRQGALQTLGFRLGIPQTGAAVFGGIISAEERASMARIADIEAKKGAALLSAETAYRSEKWDQYVEFVDQAEKEYNQQIEAVKEFNEKVVEKNKIALEQSRKDTALSLLQEGITDPLTIASITGLELEEVGDMITALDFENRIESVIHGVELTFSSLEGKEATSYLKEEAERLGVPQKQLASAVAERALKREAEETAINIKERSQTLAEQRELRIREENLRRGKFDENDRFEIGGIQVSGSTAAVINGVSSLKGLTPSVRQGVESDLNRLEVFSDTPPQWFRDRMEQELQQSLLDEPLQEFWDEFKDVIFPEEEDEEETGTSELSDEEFLKQLREGI